MDPWSSLNFVQHYLEHTKRYESPTSFWRWSAYGAVASVLRDNCYRRMGDNFLYPNVYILLLAESSFHRKGRPVEFSEDLVREVRNTKVISGRASIQAITQELARTETDSKTGKIIKGGSAVFYAPEMSAGLVADPAAINILTDIYEPKKNYDTLLKTQAKSSIQNLVFSMIGASNEELLKSVYDGSAIRGGLLARTFLVVPNEFRDPNSLIDIPVSEYEVIKDSKKALIDKLRKVAELKGEILFDNGAKEEYNDWYIPFRRSHEKAKDKSGMLGRMHTSVLKLAMVLAASDISLTVERKHIAQAIDDCVKLIPNYNLFAMTGSKSTIKEVGALVLSDLSEAPGYQLDRRTLFHRHLMDFDALTFDSFIVNMEAAGWVTQIVNGGMNVIYKLTEKAVRQLKGEAWKNE